MVRMVLDMLSVGGNLRSMGGRIWIQLENRTPTVTKAN